MDADTVRTRQEYLNVFDKMNEGKIDILIGTQMITKGFDFPNVTLVGVIAADLSLNIGSYKAPETTFPNALNNTHLPSITGIPASGPIFPSPKTALPSLITATV